MPQIDFFQIEVSNKLVHGNREANRNIMYIFTKVCKSNICIHLNTSEKNCICFFWVKLKCEGIGQELMQWKCIQIIHIWRVKHCIILGSTAWLLLLQRFSVGRTHLVSSQCWVLIYVFAVLMYGRVRSPSRGPNKMYVYEPKQNLWRGLLELKTGKTPSPTPLPPPASQHPHRTFIIYFCRCYCHSLL